VVSDGVEKTAPCVPVAVDATVCCFGAVPNMNEWVIVKMKKGVAPMMDVPVAFYGELKVGAMFENGYMTGLYELEGEKMGDVQGT